MWRSVQVEMKRVGEPLHRLGDLDLALGQVGRVAGVQVGVGQPGRDEGEPGADGGGVGAHGLRGVQLEEGAHSLDGRDYRRVRPEIRVGSISP